MISGISVLSAATRLLVDGGFSLRLEHNSPIFINTLKKWVGNEIFDVMVDEVKGIVSMLRWLGRYRVENGKS